jgi:hypothetical protein
MVMVNTIAYTGKELILLLLQFGHLSIILLLYRFDAHQKQDWQIWKKMLCCILSDCNSSLHFFLI